MSLKECAAKSYEAKGYRMIESFDINNFRCFKHANLKDLRRINVIVGDNASGKTALLEGLYLTTYAQPQGATLVRLARNRPVPDKVVWNHSLFETFWEDLFNDCSHSKIIKANFTDSARRNITIEISYGDTKYVNILSTPASPLTGPIPPLVFKRSGLNGTEIGKLRIDENGNPVFEGQLAPLPVVYALSSTYQFYHLDIANFYGELCRRKEEHIVVKAFQKEFPQINDIVVLPDGVVSGIFVSIDSIKNVRIPLSVVSAGAARFLNILVAIAMHKNGIVLVDEIENGLYWKKIPKIWAILRQLCVDCDVQLFVTTHSNECLQALLPAMEENVDDFALIRTEIDKKGDRQIRQFYGKSFKAALVMRGEVR